MSYPSLMSSTKKGSKLSVPNTYLYEADTADKIFRLRQHWNKSCGA